MEDDLDDGPADETVQCGFDGTEYEIDRSNKNAGVFRQQLAPFEGRTATCSRSAS